MAARGEMPLCEDLRVNHSPAEASPPQRARLLPSCGGSEALRRRSELELCLCCPFAGAKGS